MDDEPAKPDSDQRPLEPLPNDPPVEAPAVETPPAEAPAAAWVVPGFAPASPRSKTKLTLTWVVALMIAGFGGWFAMRGAELRRPDGTAFNAGYAFGTAVGAVIFPFLVAAALRLLFARLRRRPGGKEALRSPWVPLGGALLAGIFAAGNIASLAPPPAVDAATAMHVNPPFILQETDAAMAAQIEQGMREEGAVRGSIASREVVGEDGSISLLVAADARLRAGDFADVVEGLETGAGVAPTIETIAGREVAIVDGPSGFIGTWLDPPLLMTAVALDLATLRLIVQAVIESS